MVPLEFNGLIQIRQLILVPGTLKKVSNDDDGDSVKDIITQDRGKEPLS